MKNKMQDVRNLMIQQMEQLVNPEQEVTEMDIRVAKEVANLGKALVESAKAEALAMKCYGDLPLNKTSNVCLDDHFLLVHENGKEE